MPTPHRHRTQPSTRRRPQGRLPRIRRRGEDGQSLVEFALIVPPLLMLLLGVIQFGFIFNSVVTLSTAAREAARDGTVYQYSTSVSKSANDLARNNKIKSTLLASMNGLAKTSPQFSNGSSWTTSTSGTTSTFTNGDITITYELPSGVTDNDPRSGYRVTVNAAYHQDLMIPLISNLLPRDANGRLTLGGTVTMVLN